jgi:hypothetical protein
MAWSVLVRSIEPTPFLVIPSKLGSHPTYKLLNVPCAWR